MNIFPKERRPALIAGLMVAIVLVSTVFSVVRNLGGDVADAHVSRTRSAVGINYKNKRFFGRVNSKRAKCERRRRVTLIKARRGISDRIVARTRTNRRGKWSISRRTRPKGRFYMVVAKRVRRTGYGPGPHLHKCRYDRSGTLRLRRR